MNRQAGHVNAPIMASGVCQCPGAEDFDSMETENELIR